MKTKGSLLENPCLLQEASLLFYQTLRWLDMTQLHVEDNLLYLKSIDIHVNLIQKIFTEASRGKSDHIVNWGKVTQNLPSQYSLHEHAL